MRDWRCQVTVGTDCELWQGHTEEPSQPPGTPAGHGGSLTARTVDASKRVVAERSPNAFLWTLSTNEPRSFSSACRMEGP